MQPLESPHNITVCQVFAKNLASANFENKPLFYLCHLLTPCIQSHFSIVAIACNASHRCGESQKVGLRIPGTVIQGFLIFVIQLDPSSSSEVVRERSHSVPKVFLSRSVEKKAESDEPNQRFATNQVSSTVHRVPKLLNESPARLP
ncbi:hypothetical protein L596_012812 [Steinernema carpocapsae]|uniref:Uncharacterized protein n=1 Tax=Steinernema carpocapsae TaxID=34508 RepID=A0A4U5NYD4_STECR|nr:hypothetical protein L596_012812 [Steinernema carpocapsae]